MEISIIVAIAIGLVAGSLLGFIIVLNYKEDIYFNSCVEKIVDSDNFLPEFIVIKIEESEDIDRRLIAKYTVRNYFFAKKNHKDFKYQTFYFYDKKDKYEIGQILRLKSSNYDKI